MNKTITTNERITAGNKFTSIVETYHSGQRGEAWIQYYELTAFEKEHFCEEILSIVEACEVDTYYDNGEGLSMSILRSFMLRSVTLI